MQILSNFDHVSTASALTPSNLVASSTSSKCSASFSLLVCGVSGTVAGRTDGALEVRDIFPDAVDKTDGINSRSAEPMMDRKDDKNKSIKNTIPKLGVFLSAVRVRSNLAARRLR